MEKRPFRLLYFGMLGTFSRPPLAALLTSSLVEVVGIVISQPRLTSDQPAIEQLPPAIVTTSLLLTPTVQQDIRYLGWQRDIPVFALRQPRHPAVLPLLAELAPDVGCVACFSRRIPNGLLALPTHGFFNLHPSLLPAYRGPEPLFWLLRDGAQPGVTVHLMTEALDQGDVVAQTAVSLPDGSSSDEAEWHCASVGADLLLQTLTHLQSGTLPRQPQGEGRYFPNPRPADFFVSTSWSARRVFNFMRGTAVWNHPYRIVGLDGEVWAKTAVGYHPTEQLGQPVVWPMGTGEKTAVIQFNPGTVEIIL
ncbi:MAG: formyltransferase family protein [Chloroflexota bacterium]